MLTGYDPSPPLHGTVIFILSFRRRPGATLFPYTTLFRSRSFSRRLSAERTSRTNLSAPLMAKFTKIGTRSEEHTSELQSLRQLVCRLLLEKKKMDSAEHVTVSNELS